MKNLVEKFTPQTTEIEDDGVVAIEYVIVAAALVAVMVGLFSGAFAALTTELTGIIQGID